MTRTEIIQLLIDKYDLKLYLEIGVFDGANFNKIRCDLKHSVDPNYPATFEMASDEFFFDNPSVVLYDIIFIDGLHTAKQAYKDIKSSYSCMTLRGFIVVHDCNPATKWHTRPESEYNRGEEWNGTTYRGFIKFKEEHPELTCFTVNADYGCGIITDRPILKNAICDKYWDYFEQNRTELLQLIDVDVFKKLI